jgi:hypothetical protein
MYLLWQPLLNCYFKESNKPAVVIALDRIEFPDRSQAAQALMFVDGSGFAERGSHLGALPEGAWSFPSPRQNAARPTLQQPPCSFQRQTTEIHQLLAPPQHRNHEPENTPIRPAPARAITAMVMLVLPTCASPMAAMGRRAPLCLADVEKKCPGDDGSEGAGQRECAADGEDEGGV